MMKQITLLLCSILLMPACCFTGCKKECAARKPAKKAAVKEMREEKDEKKGCCLFKRICKRCND